jgi:large subunit ribosomal protein L31
MKDKIHPNYQDIVFQCACGASYKTRSTLHGGTTRVDICASCHPFYTGKQKFVDTAGRVEKFQKKFGGEYFQKDQKDAKGKKSK